ncbi:signal recognition particle-docking protein FtsY [Anaerobiospirillum sp. NML120448]|uniref:signal recognition particle-docking protein FtsY n=1 Tax=Anaerobiospirillum sp. NML120448 TaxID=2932816 RepID=UPI001FF2EC3A|nr:signal recognition particle-docking protein FtsY [Anaerobiospirillum sp. NML120448]MCK0513353.1 signal recognition particle-docking protein FtsY [Anaerobiospirillum sp. NML120448]
MGFFAKLFGINKKKDEANNAESQVDEKNVAQDLDDQPIADAVESQEQLAQDKEGKDSESIFANDEASESIAEQVEEAEKKEPSCDSSKNTKTDESSHQPHADQDPTLTESPSAPVASTKAEDTTLAEQAQQAQLAVQAEQERLEAERLEAERIAAEKAEQERLEAERREAERIAAEKAEQERLEAERREAERIAAEKAEQERLEAERREAERIAAEKAEQERLEAERREAERIAAEKAEQERLEAERREAERLAAEKAEQERLEAERREAERIAAEKAEQERLEAERREAERLEAERIAAEKAEQERLEAERLEAERIAAEKAEQERLEAEAAAAEAAEAAEAEKANEEAQAQESAKEAMQEERKSFFSRLKKTRDNLAFGVSSLIFGRKIDEDLYEDLETALLTADLGVETTQKVIERLRDESRVRDLRDAGALRNNLKKILSEILYPCEKPLIVYDHTPFVILMVGVNGAGKTTTIGKLARKYQDMGLKVMLAAGDTFRAAAVEQLKEWGERANVPVIAQATGSDSASVLYDAVSAAKARGIDVLLCDTAGRLQNKDHLMDELRKIVRVMQKIDPKLPHETMLVLDAATGQNAVSQTKVFTEAVNVTGLTLTKLDGSAKGGVVFSLANLYEIPIRYVGIGEKAEDLREFKIDPFVDALVEDEEHK